MPQLDKIIIFSQIFWLFFIFTIFYIILTHFFLPLFIKSLKSRKRILESNILESAKVINQFNTNQINLQKIFLLNFNSIKILLDKDFFLKTKEKEDFFLKEIDEKIGLVLFDSILYCDNKILESIIFNYKSLNLKFKS